MKKLIEGWIHQPGWHCASTVISDLMTFKGLRMSEAMCFGLGSGLGFAYLEGDLFNPTRMTAVRSRVLETNFLEAVGLPPRWETEKTPEEALEKSKEYIDKGVPLLMRADIFHLDYYNSSSHFPGHVICMWGYDDEEQEIYVADTERPELQGVPYPSIMKARFTNMPGYPVKGDHITGNFSPPSLDMAAVIRKAMLRQAKDLFKPEFGHIGPIMGFPAMEKCAESLPAWPGAKDWQWSARWFYQVIEKRGTGGGAFRKLYADFLKEAGEISPRFEEAAPVDQMRGISARWTELSEFLKGISEKEKPEGFDEAARMLSDIHDREKSFFTKVEKGLA